MLFYVGAVFVAVLAVKLFAWLHLNFVAKVDLKQKYAKAGEWAVVTGASDGIGKGMAVDLAKRGFKVVIIARTESKLSEVAKMITERKSTASIVTFDFAAADDKAYADLFKKLDAVVGANLAVMVNNVGVNYEHPKPFESTDVEEDLRILKVNVEAQVRMSKWALRKYIEKKGGGAIVSLSSMFGGLPAPAPYLSTYSGSKAFNASFSRSLAAEAAQHKVDVMSIAPGFVVSQMSKMRPGFFSPTAAAFAYQSLNKLSLTAHTEGHRHHEILSFVLSLIPSGFLATKVAGVNFSTMKRAQKKKEREAAAKKE